MKRALLIIYLIIVVLMPTVAKATGILYQGDDPLVLQVERLLIQTGTSLPSYVSPISANHLLNQLKKINQQKLKEWDLIQFKWLQKELTEGPLKRYNSLLALEAGIRLAPEFYLHSNLDKELTEREWVFNQKLRDDFLTFYGEATINDNFYLLYNHPYHRKIRGWHSPTEETAFVGGFNHNMVLTDSLMDHSVPHSAFLGFSNNLFTFAIGRDSLNIGRGSTGNFLLGNHLGLSPYTWCKLEN